MQESLTVRLLLLYKAALEILVDNHPHVFVQHLIYLEPHSRPDDTVLRPKNEGAGFQRAVRLLGDQHITSPNKRLFVQLFELLGSLFVQLLSLFWCKVR